MPASNWAITGLYFFDNDVVRYAAEVKPSWRGELEITDLHNCYLAAGALHVEKMGRGFAWLDTGTFESLIDAASFVQTLEQRQGMKIACPEEIAYRMGFINRAHLLELAKSLNKSGYGDYLLKYPGLSVSIGESSWRVPRRRPSTSFAIRTGVSAVHEFALGRAAVRLNAAGRTNQTNYRDPARVGQAAGGSATVSRVTGPLFALRWS